MVEPLKSNHAADTARRVWECLVPLVVPYVGPAFVEVLKHIKPPESQQELAAWSQEVCETLGAISRTIDGLTKDKFAFGTITLSGASVISSGFNISSVTDCGHGRIHVSFTSYPDQQYQLAIESMNELVVSVSHKDNAGFDLRVDGGGISDHVAVMFMAILH